MHLTAIANRTGKTIMIQEIKGLHHVTSLASDAVENNAFFANVLGLRRVKKTVNFDAPDVYHLYYGDAAGTPGSVMTYFPFVGLNRGRAGAGEVSMTRFSVPPGAIGFWKERFSTLGLQSLKEDHLFGQNRLCFHGPDGDPFALVESDGDERIGWTRDVANDVAIRGFHSASMRLRNDGRTNELLTFMGYQQSDEANGVKRFQIAGGNGADIIDVEAAPGSNNSEQGSGSVHHIAFAVENRAAQLEVRRALMDTGYQVTPVIDRDYFWAIYFRTPGGVLFEIATNEPGFDHDEDTAHLGEALKLPTQHEHLRARLEQHLQPLVA